MSAEEATEAVLEKQEKGHWVGWLSNQSFFLLNTPLSTVGFTIPAQHLSTTEIHHESLSPVVFTTQNALCELTRETTGSSGSVCLCASLNNCKRLIEILNMSLHHFQPFKQGFGHSCQHCYPIQVSESIWNTGYGNFHLKARSLKPVPSRSMHDSDYILRWKGQVDAAQHWPMTEQSWQLLHQIFIHDNQKWQSYKSRWSCLNSAQQMSM